MTSNVDKDEYRYNGYAIGFGVPLLFSLSNGEFGNNISIFCVENSSMVHAGNSKKVILFFV